ncbi:YfjI family protein [uncultured Sphingomonas sp.]|uniref:YfjI family protein n=1 Tax=uncultured Sphingomonas sp. TaxID=158754 RepID=UPI0025FC91F3|nr:YfjI family protein [uncultured Sphingomonas sp.]
MANFADFNAPVDLPKPRPLVEAQRAEPYPVNLLPPIIGEAVEEVASYVQAPVAMIAASALAAVSTAVQTRYSVRPDAAVCGPASLFFLTVAESGERKSTVDKVFTGPIRNWEAEQRKLLRERLAKYEAAKKDWERQGEELDRNIAGGFLTTLLDTAQDPRVAHALAMPQMPKRVRVLRSDDTQEALAMALQDHPVASIMSAEAGVIFGSHSMKAESVTANLAQVNVMWDGGVIQRDRIGSGEVQVEGMRVTMGLQVQPAVLSNFVEKTGGLARGIGYFARFLFSQPESTQGARFYVEPPAAQPAAAAFRERLTTLLREEAVFDEYDRLETQYIGFDAMAQKTWIGFHNEVEEQLQADEQYAGIKDVASKAADNAARLACCLHVFQNGPATPIGIEPMLAACKLMRWYLDEAVRFGHAASAAPELADAQLLQEWLVREMTARGRAGTSLSMSKNDIRRRGPNKLRQAKSRRLDDALELLADHHRIMIASRPGKKGADVALRAEVWKEYQA